MSQGKQESSFLKGVQDCFGPQGALSHATENFRPRVSQVEFSKRVAEAIEENGTVVVEAGTGTGKTFAYLTPALLSGRRVIVSTGGKPLQDQLFNKDLPALEKALGVISSACVLKGRSNYICLHRLSHARDDGLPSQQCFADLRVIEAFAAVDAVGDKSTIHGVAEDAVIWPFVTSTKENCLGNKCPHAEKCFVNRARSLAKESQVVIVNHHLFLSALSVRDEVDAEILPKADVIVLDEAHKLPEIAVDFFGSEFSTFQVKEAVRQVKRLLMSRHRDYAPEGTSWDQHCDPVIYALQDFVLELERMGVKEGDSIQMARLNVTEKLTKAFEIALGKLQTLNELVVPLVGEDADLEKAIASCVDLCAQAVLWLKVLRAPDAKASLPSQTPLVRWLSRSQTEARLNETPIRFSEEFKHLREEHEGVSWVFTSATLATGKGDFSHFLQELGLEGAKTFSWPSPFDYENQAIFYVPEKMPVSSAVSRDTYIEALVEESWPIIDMVGGRTFFLCTSRQGMIYAGEALRRYVQENKRDYDVLVQNEDTRTRLIEKFRKHGHAILVATMSFWEGIDIKGETLSCVVIDKLPFAPKEDPVLEAQCDWIESQGGNPFHEHQIPLAAIALKQGVGRLIRSENDRGILIMGDKRIIPGSGSRYGKQFMDSIPNFTRTQRIGRVIDFWLHPDDWS